MTKSFTSKPRAASRPFLGLSFFKNPMRRRGQLSNKPAVGSLFSPIIEGSTIHSER